MRTKSAVLSGLALIAAAAGAGSAAQDRVAASTAAVSAVPARPRGGVLFYSDLGPDEIDVSSYPSQQRENYAVYARACSRCHSLARSINAPYTSRGWWEFYMTGMRARGRIAGRPFSRDEIKAVLDFLDYDSRARKIERAAAFERSAEELKRRFDDYVDQRMSDLQNKNQQRMIPAEPRSP